MLDAVCPAQDDVARRFPFYDVHRNRDSCFVGLIHCGADFFQGVVIALGVVRDQLDGVSAVVDVPAHRFAHFLGRVGVDVLKLPERPLLGRDVVRLSPEGRDDFPRGQNGWPREPSLPNRSPQIGGSIVGVVANLFHHGEASLQHQPRVPRPAQSAESAALFQIGSFDSKSGRRVGRVTERQVGMRVHQPRQHPRIRKVNHFGAGGNLHIRAHLGDLSVFDQDGLIPGHCACRRVNQVTGANGCGLSKGRACEQQENHQQPCQHRRLLVERRHREQHTQNERKTGWQPRPRSTLGGV